MKILWICNVMLPQIATDMSKDIANGGGWLIGLSQDLLQQENINLSVCFPLLKEDKLLEGEVEGLQYFGFPQSTKNLSKYNSDNEVYIEQIIKEVNPDVIHVFGTEYSHTLSTANVCEKLCMIDKMIINIQGLVSVYSKHYYANLPTNIINRYTLRDIIKNSNIKKQKYDFIKRGRFEVEAIKKVKHVIGRTDWDRACVYNINSEAKYHFCNETLRESFYNSKWDINNCEKYSIFISQCSYPIKGFHFMLEAMPEILKRYPKAHIYTTGNNPLKPSNLKEKLKMTSYQKYIGELIKKYNLENNITFLGSLNEEEMCNRFVRSHVFVSPSAIENSPNSVGEAMILGVPTVSSDVGGVKNMLVHNEDGFVYQHDAPYMISHYVCEIFEDNQLAEKFSKNARHHANNTHNRSFNLIKVLNIYKEITKL